VLNTLNSGLSYGYESLDFLRPTLERLMERQAEPARGGAAAG
jgi:hypothetical protein